MKAIKVLFLCHDTEIFAGTEKTISLLMRNIDAERFETSALIDGEGFFARHLREITDNVHICPAKNVSFLKRRRFLKNFLSEHPQDVVQLHVSRFFSPVIRSSGVKIVERLNMNRHRGSWYLMRNRHIDLWTARWIDRFVPVSESLKAEYVKRGYPPEKMVTIYNGVAVPETISREALRLELDLKPETLMIGAVGRLTEQKGVDFFLRVAAVIATKLENVVFPIAGDGERRDQLKRLANELGIADGVHFLGHRRDNLDVLGSLDLLIYPSRWEPFANTILESMAVGTPVAASNVGGNAEIIDDGENGLLFSLESPGKAAEKIINVCLKHGELETIADKAKETVRRYSIEAMARRHEELYADLVEARPPRDSTF